MNYPKLMNATIISDYILSLEYDNGETRSYDFSVNFSHPFYKPLEDINLFRSFNISNGNIEWATGQDFCPFTLFENSKLIEKQKTARPYKSQPLAE